MGGYFGFLGLCWLFAVIPQLTGLCSQILISEKVFGEFASVINDT